MKTPISKKKKNCLHSHINTSHPLSAQTTTLHIVTKTFTTTLNTIFTTLTFTTAITSTPLTTTYHCYQYSKKTQYSKWYTQPQYQCPLELSCQPSLTVIKARCCHRICRRRITASGRTLVPNRVSISSVSRTLPSLVPIVIVIVVIGGALSPLTMREVEVGTWRVSVSHEEVTTRILEIPHSGTS